jgi:hypothetical protein
MPIRRCLPALLTAAAVVTGGCGSGSTGPDPLPVADGPLYAHAGSPVERLTWDLKQNKAGVVQTSGGQIYDFRIEAMLFADGTAAGVATLANPGDPSSRFQYHFETGRTVCEDATPVAHFEGVVDPAGRDRTSGWVVHLLPYMEQGPLTRDGEGPEIMWRWAQNDPAGRAGEYFVTAVTHVYVSPDICGSR